MNGKTYPYLELAALPPVGAALLDPRPAFVFRGDGSGILWANAAGAAFLGGGMGSLLHRRFVSGSAFARQLARLARLIPADRARLEILRFNIGLRLDALPAACRRLYLSDATTAVLAVAQIQVQRESLATRAERLADAIASKECLVAVLAADGRVLGASGGFDDLAPASAAIDDMIEGVAAAPAGLLKRPIEIENTRRPAGIVRFAEGEQPLFLLIVGPADASEQQPAEGVASEGPAPTATQDVDPRVAEEPASIEESAAEHRQAEAALPAAADGQNNGAAKSTGGQASAEATAESASAPTEGGPALRDGGDASSRMEFSAGPGEGQAASLLQPKPPMKEEPTPTYPVEPAADKSGDGKAIPRSHSATFLWQTDRDRRFTFVSPELAALAGSAAAAIVGRTWSEAAERFALDPEGRVAALFAGESSWNGETVNWPVGDGYERLAVELSAIAVLDRERRFAGFRGFGTSRANLQSAGPPIEPFEAEAEVEAASASVSQPAAATAGEPEDADQPTPAPAPGRMMTTAKTETAETEVKPTTGPAVPEPLASEEDIDDAARKCIEEGAERAAPDERSANEIRARASRAGAPDSEQATTAAAIAEGPPPAGPATPPVPETKAPAVSNVVRLPGAPVRALPTERLSGTEQDAFRRIAETLGVKMPEGMRTPEERRRSETGARSGAASEAEPDTRLLDKLPVGIVVYRERGILFVNRTLLDYLGYDTPEDFAKAGGAEAIFPDRGRAETAFPDAHGILTARRRDGADLRVEARLHAVPWGAATALMLSLVKHDPPPEPARNDSLVEHLVAAERRIDELATILDTATDGIVVIDEHGRIENINKSAEALFGVEAGAVVRQPFTELFAEESRKAALDYLDGLASNGVASVLNDGREVIGKVPKGGLIPLFMTMGRLGGGPKFCAVLRDITYWKNVEEELIAAKRAAETANAQKSEFLAKISHEIRTPLNAIIGFSEVMMAERFGPIGNERYRDYLRDIHVSGEHLLSLINDLLDLSKIEAGKLELAFEAVAVNQTIQECVALMQPQANRERIIIRTSLSAGVPNVVADQRSLRQILLNLLSNAIKFTGAGGQVIVATTLEESGEVVLRIRDTGIGMSEKDLETAMKPFRQVSTTGARRGEGTGLGLPLTKALVEANRASFSIDSTPNQGTLVKITFPTTRVLAG